MVSLMIGIDLPGVSHTAVAINGIEEPPGGLRVRASASQAGAVAGVDGGAAGSDLGRGRR